MNYFNKQKVVFWIMVLMILINISAFTSFFFFHRADRTVVADTAACSGTCRFLDRQLSLNAVQSEKVNAINLKFREHTEPLVSEIKTIRNSMLDELGSDKPDTLKLNGFTEKIGELQKQLQRAAIIQFQQLRMVCNAEQCRKLSTIYLEVYGCRKMDQGMGTGMQHQQGRNKVMPCCEKNQ